MGALFTGVATALATPFTESGVDEVLLEKMAARQIEAGVSALVVLGTTGEPCTMTPRERQRALRAAVNAAAGRVPVIAGAGANDTNTAMDNARMAREAGAQGVLVVTPYYNKCTQAGLVAYFQAVAGAGELPTILYNVPSRTGMNMLPETALRASRHPLVCGFKEASGDICQLGEAARLLGDNCPVYAGNDDMALPALSLGAKGLISVSANVVPDMVSRMVASYMAGDGAAALALHHRLSRLNCLMFCEVSPIPCKAALSMLGLGDGRVRPPLTPLTRKNARALREALRELQVDRICAG